MGKYQSYEKYKDSGVEWLGEIPEGWEIKRLRFILKEQFANGIFKKREYWGKCNPIINVFDVYTQNNIVDVSTLDRVECDEEELSKYSALYGDFFFVRSSLKLEGIGKSATLLEPSEQIVFYLLQTIVNEFRGLGYWFRKSNFKSKFNSSLKNTLDIKRRTGKYRQIFRQENNPDRATKI